MHVAIFSADRLCVYDKYTGKRVLLFCSFFFTNWLARWAVQLCHILHKIRRMLKCVKCVKFYTCGLTKFSFSRVSLQSCLSAGDLSSPISWLETARDCGVADDILRPSTQRVFDDASGSSDQQATERPR